MGIVTTTMPIFLTNTIKRLYTMIQSKTYKTINGCTDLYITINNERVHFQCNNIFLKYGKFTTRDKQLQDAIENSPYYDDIFTLLETRVIDGTLDEPKKEEPVILTSDNIDDVPAEEIKSFSNFNELRNFLSSRDDVRFEEVRSYIKAKEVAARLGIKFKIVNPNVNE